jgi:hypothetical protein
MARKDVYDGQLLDITEPENGVEVEIRADGTVLWVHVDGVTVLRICRIQTSVSVNDHIHDLMTTHKQQEGGP